MLGLIILAALLAWGIYKCITIAKRPTANAKCAYSLAIILAAFGILPLAMPLVAIVFIGLRVKAEIHGTSGVAAHILSVVGAVGAVLLFVIPPVMAIIFAIRGIREIGTRHERGDRGHYEGRGMAIWAIVLSIVLLGLASAGVVLGVNDKTPAAHPTQTH
jgi:hypothetical protein